MVPVLERANGQEFKGAGAARAELGYGVMDNISEG